MEAGESAFLNMTRCYVKNKIEAGFGEWSRKAMSLTRSNSRNWLSRQDCCDLYPSIKFTNRRDRENRGKLLSLPFAKNL